MTTQLSSSHLDLELNGIRFEGYADEDPPVDFDNIELSEAEIGKDGTMSTTGTGMQGAKLTVKLLPTSPTVPKLMSFHAQIQRGARIIWRGTYGDPDLNIFTQLEGGVLMEAPPASMPGKTSEWVFQFEKTIPQYEAAKFAPSVNAFSN